MGEGRGRGGEQELEGTESVGVPKPEKPKRDMAAPTSGRKLRAREGPGARSSIEGPHGLGDRKRRPPKHETRRGRR